MVPLHAQPRPTRAFRRGLALLFLLALPWTAPAAPPGGPVGDDVYCWKDLKFRIPIADGAPGQNGISQVLLYVSEDYGTSYHKLGVAKAGQTYFSVVVERAGRSYVVTLSPTGQGFHPGPGPGPGPGPDRTDRERGRGDYLLTNKLDFPLAFDVVEEGKSGIAEIEVWMKPDGKPWELRRDLGGPGKKSPLTLRVEQEGRYGFTLIAVSGVGERYDKPAETDPPPVVGEVDTTPPKANLLGAPVV